MSQNIIRDYVADAQVVFKNYPFQAFYIKKYQYRLKKAVWFIKTNNNNFALKRYCLDQEQWEFMISAYDFLSQHHINVAPLINTKENKPWVKYNNCYYILTNWVKGHTPDYTNKCDLTMLIRGIAELHLASRDYICPHKKYEEKYLGQCPEETRRKQGLLLEYKYEAENHNYQKFSKLYLLHFQRYFEIMEEAIKALDNFLYQKWVNKIKKTPCLCVNGFSPHNFSLGDNNVWLLHLDNICIDLPTRDLRKILYKVMYIKGNWCSVTFSDIMKNYLEVYPLSKDELKILLAELKIPHFFINITSKYYLNQKPQWSKEMFEALLIKAIKLEQDKYTVLKRFWQLI